MGRRINEPLICFSILALIFWFIFLRGPSPMDKLAASEAEKAAFYKKISDPLKEILPLVANCNQPIEFGYKRKHKMVIWNIRKQEIKDGFHGFKAEIGNKIFATSKDEKFTFILIDQKLIPRGTYSISGDPGYAVDSKIYAIEWPEKACVGFKNIGIMEPFESRAVGDSSYFERYIYDVDQWIKYMQWGD
jgi:hypothetical protein